MKYRKNGEYRCLLVNPWIYDFAAFDLWSKPLGLLYLGSVLREHGFKINLLDCMDRSDPESGVFNDSVGKKYRTGKFHKERLMKPPGLSGIRRHYCRYGFPIESVTAKLDTWQKPDVILLTSHMLYWYPAVKDMADLLRVKYPGVPLILGGIYATLAAEHATKYIDVDYILPGEAENFLPKFLKDMIGFELNIKRYSDLDSLPFPAIDLYPDLEYLPLLTSRGCPLRCSFCASYRVSGKFRQRSSESVVAEIMQVTEESGIVDVAFYDDALLFKKEKHFHRMMRSIIKGGRKLRFHSPNGLQAEEIDQYTAELMKEAGFKTVRLSLETVSKDRIKDMSRKISPESFVRAVDNLEKAGFKRNEIEAYTLMGLPDQKVDEVIDTLCFAANQGIIARPSGFSPIPKTKDWERAIENGDLMPDADLLETNNSIYINSIENFGEEKVSQIKNLTKELNDRIRKGLIINTGELKNKYSL